VRDDLTPFQRSVIPDAENREKDDFYPTPPEATEALLRHVELSGRIWECACGEGDMSRVLEAASLDVYSTDLVDRGYGRWGIDFLMEWQGAGCDWIVTNPPFKLAHEFVAHGLGLCGRVAVLLELRFLEGIGRKPLFESGNFQKLIVFSDRVTIARGSMTENKSNRGMKAFGWFIFDSAYDGAPTIEWTLAGGGNDA